jgi:hypothetical protein
VHILRLLENDENIPDIEDKKYYDFILAQYKRG